MIASQAAAEPLAWITRAGIWALALVPLAAVPVLPATVTGQLHALTVFARFQGEGGGTAAPEFASRIFAADQPGSLTHYFNEMSRGQYRLTGESLPGWVTSDSPAEGYLPPAGTFGKFSREILAQADVQVDLSRFDDDGPDGLPASGDDDGYVDFLFVVTRSSPRDFIVDAATGIAALGLGEEYVSNDRDPARPGGRIRVRADQDPHGAGGVLQQGATFEVAVGNMAHEFGHHLGLVDLYDLQYGPGPEDDSAGVGYWDLMAHGARGWNEQGGPNPLSAWSLMQLGWLGVANAQLVEVEHDLPDAALTDVNAGGKVYRLKTRTAGVYYLVEHRRRGTSFYERNLPAEGVLIWRVDESRGTNNDEEYKRVDLVCADGTFADVGAPLGLVPDPIGGQDNLDYWAHDEGYRQSHAGNLGDAGDPFDGDRYTEFSVVTNPAATAGIAVSRVRRQGQGMVADLRVGDRRRAGTLTEDEVWSDTVEVVGDVTVPQGRTLTIAPETVVRVGVDALHTGRNPQRVEVEVLGDLVTAGGSRGQVIITSAAARPAPGDWYGLVVHPLGRISLWQVLLEYPVYGIVTAGSGLRRPLELNAVVVRNALQDGLALEGVEQTVELASVQVHDSGGIGIRVEGSGYTRISLPHLTGNRAGGLELRGGYLECRDGRFADNGLSTADGANLVLGEEVFGEISGNYLSGGIGIYCLGTQEVVVTGNQFDRCRIGLVSLSAVPRVTGNSFTGTELVTRVEGFAVPTRFDLNAVQEAARLVDNQTDRAMAATNNWWGRVDETWIAARMSGQVVWKPYLNFDPRREIGFSLAPNYPNPFNGSTVIGYTVGINAAIVSGRARTVLEVRTIAGGLVRRLVDEAAAPGIFTATWDGHDESGARSASGVYYLQLQVGPLRELRPLLLLK